MRGGEETIIIIMSNTKSNVKQCDEHNCPLKMPFSVTYCLSSLLYIRFVFF